jgi:hypothetical protein
MTDSLVMQAWHEYTDKLKEGNRASKAVPRLPGSTGIYLSEATGCPRKASLRILRYKSAPFSAQSQVNMASGIKGEEKIALVLEARGWSLERQYPLQTKYGNGRIDILADIREWDAEYRDKPLILEIKTTTLATLPHLPRAYHVDQCLLYMGFMRQDTGIVPLGEVTYLLKQEHSKSDGVEKVTSFPVEWNPERFAYLISQLDLIDSHVRQNIPVPIELAGLVAPDKPPCLYPNNGKCGYFAHCWGGPVREREQETMEF